MVGIFLHIGSDMLYHNEKDNQITAKTVLKLQGETCNHEDNRDEETKIPRHDLFQRFVSVP